MGFIEDAARATKKFVLSPEAEERRPPKPMSRWFILLMQIMEPFQIVILGGSNMAWVRHIGEANHQMGHNLFRLGLDPEEGVMGCKTTQVKDWIKKWGR